MSWCFQFSVDEKVVDEGRNRKIYFNENAEVIVKNSDDVTEKDDESSSSSSDDETAL